MKTTIDWTFGNFDVSVEVSCDIGGPAAEHVLRHCALNILQRKPAGEVEKALAGSDWPKGKNGSALRPAGFSRDSITYTDARAEKVSAGFSGSTDLAPDGEPECLLTYRCTEVGEHVKGEVKDSKFTEEREIFSRHDKAGDLVAWAQEKISFYGDLVDASDAPTLEFLRAIRKVKLAAMRAAAAL